MEKEKKFYTKSGGYSQEEGEEIMVFIRKRPGNVGMDFYLQQDPNAPEGRKRIVGVENKK